MMRSNAALAATAVILSLFLWIYVRLVYGVSDTFRVLEVPVAVTNEPPAGFDMQLHPGSATIRVTIKGPSDAVAGILRQDIRATVDLTKVPTDGKSVQVPVAVEAPGAVKVTPQSKATVIITRLLQREVPVKVAFVVAPPAGATVGSYTIEPSSVTVEARTQNELDFVKFVAVSIDPTVPQAAAAAPELRAIGEDGKPDERVRVLGPPVTVKATSLTGPLTTRRVGVHPPKLLNPPVGYRVTPLLAPNDDEVILSGDPTLLERQPAYLETEPVDVSGLRQDTTKVVHLKVPDGLRVVGGNDVHVTIQVRR